MSKEKKVIRLSPDDEAPMAERNKRRKVDTQAGEDSFRKADKFHLLAAPSTHASSQFLAP